ncbi:hypothetical protein H5410_017967 [Solanum commersonii]|uniref:HMG box domain-containing protein n=1 Tax=Solanum commersonii TaxID=4109 RepID=A0A9J6A1Y8_SOLCO|nr:hypothetical protein H5410_017967 [Solanum commersonii]
MKAWATVLPDDDHILSVAGGDEENVKKSNSGIVFYEVGRILGERWNKLRLAGWYNAHHLIHLLPHWINDFAAEEKKPFEAMAKADKKRYSEQISNINLSNLY